VGKSASLWAVLCAILDGMAFAHPETNLKALSLGPGMKVADIGAGTGLYALSAARAVGDSGRVYAIDVQQELLLKLKAESKRAHINTIEMIWANAEKPGGTKLKDASIDAVILSNVLFQAEDMRAMLLESIRILKPGGKLLIIDWTDSFGGLGPKPADVVRREEARSLALGEHLIFVNEFKAGEHHYGLIFSK